MNKDKFPIEVAEMYAVKNYSLIKAWRIFKKKKPTKAFSF